MANLFQHQIAPMRLINANGNEASGYITDFILPSFQSTLGAILDPVPHTRAGPPTWVLPITKEIGIITNQTDATHLVDFEDRAPDIVRTHPLTGSPCSMAIKAWFSGHCEFMYFPQSTAWLYSTGTGRQAFCATYHTLLRSAGLHEPDLCVCCEWVRQLAGVVARPLTA